LWAFHTIQPSIAWAIKRSQLIFVCKFVKNQRILLHFTVRFRNERHMWQYELHPPHLINVATLLYESQNTENVILQWDITKDNCIRCTIASSKWTRVILKCALNLLIWGVIQQCMYQTKIHDIDDLWKRLMQTCFEFDQNIIDAGVTIWDHVCMLVVDTLNTRCGMNIHLYDPPEHFMKLSM